MATIISVSAPEPLTLAQDQDATVGEAPIPIMSFMAITGGNIFKVKRPIHENMTLAALMHSNFNLDKSLTYNRLRDHPDDHPEINDFIRGVVWNDDPACLLFDEKVSNNFTYSTGFKWATQFGDGEFGSPNWTNIIGRSHFWDLQFLHAMGSSHGEAPHDTKRKILMWLKAMYSIAIDAPAALGDQSISDVSSKINTTPELKSFFDPWSAPSVNASMRTLLTLDHHSPANLQHRALGSCFHVLQDSYAHGHTRRVLLNPQDKVNPNDPSNIHRFTKVPTSPPTPYTYSVSLDSLDFKPNHYDQWGAVQNFHTYKGQDSGKHDHFDHGDADMSRIDPANLDTFDHLLGVRFGIDKCIQLANFWVAKTPWEQGVEKWLADDVFAIAPGTGGSDTSV